MLRLGLLLLIPLLVAGLAGLVVLAHRRRPDDFGPAIRAFTKFRVALDATSRLADKAAESAPDKHSDRSRSVHTKAHG